MQKQGRKCKIFSLFFRMYSMPVVSKLFVQETLEGNLSLEESISKFPIIMPKTKKCQHEVIKGKVINTKNIYFFQQAM